MRASRTMGTALGAVGEFFLSAPQMVAAIARRPFVPSIPFTVLVFTVNALLIDFGALGHLVRVNG
jgi:hypothetical protein